MGLIWRSVVCDENEAGQWPDWLYGYDLRRNESHLSWPLRLGVVCDENQTGLRLNRSDRCGLCWKLLKSRDLSYWVQSIWKLNKTMVWLILQERYLLKIKLNYCDQSDWVWSMMKSRHDNDVTNHIDVVYPENETMLVWTISLRMVCDKNRIGQQRDWSYKFSLCRKQYYIIGTYRTECSLWWN